MLLLILLPGREVCQIWAWWALLNPLHNNNINNSSPSTLAAKAFQTILVIPSATQPPNLPIICCSKQRSGELEALLLWTQITTILLHHQWTLWKRSNSNKPQSNNPPRVWPLAWALAEDLGSCSRGKTLSLTNSSSSSSSHLIRTTPYHPQPTNRVLHSMEVGVGALVCRVIKWTGSSNSNSSSSHLKPTILPYLRRTEACRLKIKWLQMEVTWTLNLHKDSYLHLKLKWVLTEPDHSRKTQTWFPLLRTIQISVQALLVDLNQPWSKMISLEW